MESKYLSFFLFVLVALGFAMGFPTELEVFEAVAQEVAQVVNPENKPELVIDNGVNTAETGEDEDKLFPIIINKPMPVPVPAAAPSITVIALPSRPQAAQPPVYMSPAPSPAQPNFVFVPQFVQNPAQAQPGAQQIPPPVGNTANTPAPAFVVAPPAAG